MWFGPNFIDLRVTFPGSNPSTWIIKEQISENEEEKSQDWCREMDTIPEVRGVFICSKLEGNGPKEAVMKVIMQIPWIGTEMQSAQKRGLQRGYTESIDIEVMGLERVTRAKCSLTPWLLSSKITKQTETMWVPGGYLGFVVMTRLPGVNIHWAPDMDSQERQALRQSFKKAWNECFQAGVAAVDAGTRNLLWDRKQKKCYIVDFGQWENPVYYGPWTDDLWLRWNL